MKPPTQPRFSEYFARPPRRSSLPAALFALTTLTPVPCLAGNGLNVIGVGGESVFMGGADLAVARDSTALNSNPAGLAATKGQRLDLYGTLAHGYGIRHRDALGNDAANRDDLILAALGSYARRAPDRPLAWGLGLFAQGGAGYRYPLDTAFATRDEIQTQLAILRPAVGLAAELDDGWSVGAAASLVLATLDQRIFPATSSAAPPFFGTRLKGARALAPGLRLGVMKALGPTLTLGAAYTLPSRMDFEDGRLTADMRAAGLGPVTYRRVRVSGMKTPAELGLGVAWRPAPGWELALDVSHLNWSGAMRASTLTAALPDQPLAPSTLTQTSVADWRDQTVLALGLAVDLNARTRLMAGINHGRNPVPPENLNPLLATIHDTHLTLGLRRAGRDGWDWYGGLEWGLPVTVTYTNPALPFGPNAQERSAYLAAHFMASRRWR